MTTEEIAVRSVIVGQLVRGESLAKCLGGIVKAMELCGTLDERQMAAIVDTVMQEWIGAVPQ